MNARKKTEYRTVCLLFIFALELSRVGSAQTTASAQSDNTAKVIQIREAVLRQKAVRRLQPEYPPIAKAAHATGMVKVEIDIDISDGKVIAARVISGHPFLRDSAVKAALGWRFPPALITTGPGPIIVRGTLSFDFGAERNARNSPAVARKKVDPVEALCDKGRELTAQGRYDEAVGEFNKALKIKPDSAWTHYNLGQTLVSARRYDEARASCAEALKLRGDELRRDGSGERDLIYEDATVCLGVTDFHQGRYDEAISKFRKIAELEKEMFDVRFFLGAALYRKGDNEAAIAALKESLVLKPENANAHFMLAEIYLAQSLWKEAVISYKKCLELEDGPYAPTSHYGMGIAFLKLGDKQAAMNEYHALKKINNHERAEQLLQEINK